MADGIPVIDLFAGPGGLGEGFSSFFTDGGAPAFDIRLSIEKDAHAHATLELRSFFRQFHRDDVPDEYYDFLRRSDVPLPSRRDDLFGRFPEQVEAAVSEAWRAELGRIEAARTEREIVPSGTGEG